MDIETISSNILYECISRSGLCPLDSTGGDGSTFALIAAVCVNSIDETFDLESEESIQKLIQAYVNSFMILHHNIVVNSKKFNWNWD